MQEKKITQNPSRESCEFVFVQEMPSLLQEILNIT